MTLDRLTPETIGVVMLMLGIGFAFFKRWLVLGVDHREQMAKAERETKFWRDAALKTIEIGDRATTVAERESRPNV